MVLSIVGPLLQYATEDEKDLYRESLEGTIIEISDKDNDKNKRIKERRFPSPSSSRRKKRTWW